MQLANANFHLLLTSLLTTFLIVSKVGARIFSIDTRQHELAFVDQEFVVQNARTVAKREVPTQRPNFIEQVANQTAIIGSDIKFDCKIANLAHFKTAWLRVEDKGILSIHKNAITRNYRIGLIADDNGENFQLNIKNVQPSDQGGYMCQINSVPMRYSVGYLNVLVPAQIEEVPLIHTANEGSSLNLSCKASGNPTPIVTWHREDNEQIEQVLHHGNKLLQLGPLSRLHSGAYICTAKNGVGPDVSQRHSLEVQFAPVIRVPQTELAVYLEPPSNQTRARFNNNQNQVRMICHVDSNPAGQYYWLKLGDREPTHSRRRAIELGSNDDDLALIESGNHLSNSDKYEIVIKRSQQPQRQDGEIRLERGEQVQMSLIIKRLDQNDLGWYKCIARNSLGTQSGSARLRQVSALGLTETGEQNDEVANKQRLMQLDRVKSYWPIKPVDLEFRRVSANHANSSMDQNWSNLYLTLVVAIVLLLDLGQPIKLLISLRGSIKTCQ